MRDAGIRVSIFLIPIPGRWRRQRPPARMPSRSTQAATPTPPGNRQTSNSSASSRTARDGAAAGLEVLAGHGLNYVNVTPIVAVPQIVELNIGHSIVARAALAGIDAAVRDMVALLRR